MPSSLRVLMISLDSALITRPDDDSRRRHLRYTELAGHLTILVMVTPGTLAHPIVASPHLTLIPIHARHPLLFPLIASRIGRRLMRQQLYDLILTQDLWRTGVAGVLLKWLAPKTPLLVQNHTVLFNNPAFLAEHPIRNRLLLAWARWTLHRADFYRVVADSERDYAVNIGFPAERIRVLPLATATEAFAQLFSLQQQEETRARFDLSPDNCIILWVGNAARVKRVERLIEVLPRILAAESRARLVLVGDLQNYAIDLRALAESLGVTEYVRLVPHVPHADLPAIYAMADVYAHPSAYEGAPRVFFEAGAAGLPLVGFDQPGVRERIQRGTTGYLVPDDDLNGFADAVVRLLQDDALRATMGEASREIALAHSADEYPERWVGVWREAVVKGLRT